MFEFVKQMREDRMTMVQTPVSNHKQKNLTDFEYAEVLRKHMISELHVISLNHKS